MLNVRSVRAKLGFGAFRQYDRAALLALCAAENVKQQPAVWIAGGHPSWEQLLRTIYQVRCNLFHGEKSPQSFRDRYLVFASDLTSALVPMDAKLPKRMSTTCRA
ncbi:hypothetical protein [Pseudogemmobacter bohemicus]|uniref:hypothetical protein n=1 Tax=Pseudogemmobacter bohemicus TaxID=2250708 RepID=UPI000DD479E0|nr:hypothetical protein [Pseudogemmobacter bohemicus]